MWGDDPYGKKKKVGEGLFGDKKSSGWGDELERKDLDIDLGRQEFDDQSGRQKLDIASREDQRNVQSNDRSSYSGNDLDENAIQQLKKNPRLISIFIIIVIIVSFKVIISFKHNRTIEQNSQYNMMMETDRKLKEEEFFHLNKRIGEINQELSESHLRYSELVREVDDELSKMKQEKEKHRNRDEQQDMDEEEMQDPEEIQNEAFGLKQAELRQLDEKMSNMRKELRDLEIRREEVIRQLKEQEREHWKSH